MLFLQLYKTSVVIILTMPKIGELIQQEKYWKGTQVLLQAMKLLYVANDKLRHDRSISHDKFYIPEITDKVNIMMDYKNWYHADEGIRVNSAANVS